MYWLMSNPSGRHERLVQRFIESEGPGWKTRFFRRHVFEAVLPDAMSEEDISHDALARWTRRYCKVRLGLRYYDLPGRRPIPSRLAPLWQALHIVPDIYRIDPVERSVSCVEVTITSSPGEKFWDLYWMLDCYYWSLRVAEIDRYGHIRDFQPWDHAPRGADSLTIAPCYDAPI